MGHYPVPPGASDIPGLEVAGEIAGGDAGARGGRFQAGRPRLRAGRRRRLRRTVRRRRSGSACRCRKGLSDVEAASLPETFFTVWSNVFDRGRLQQGETLAGPGRHQRHRRHRDPDGQGVRREGDRDRRQRRQVRRVREARRRPRDQLQDAGLRRRGEAAHRRQGRRRRSSTWSRASYVAREVEVPRRGRPARDHRGAGRHEERGRLRASCCASASRSPARRCARARSRSRRRSRRRCKKQRLAAARDEGRSSR